MVLILNEEYSKCPKISNTLFHFWPFALMQLFLKVLNGTANSVDPNQTAPEEQSDMSLHSMHMPFYQKT